MKAFPRRAALGLSAVWLLAPLVLAALAAPAVAPHVCDPYPIGRCGNYQRESVVHCYLLVGGQYLSPTDPNVVVLGDAGTGTAADQVALYLRLGPTQALVDDPYEAPAPFDSVFLESNLFEGLQPKPYKCGSFVWFAECEPAQWMGPFAVTNKPADEVVA